LRINYHSHDLTLPPHHLIDRYFAPEYVMHGIVNEKTDIYSFGVLLLEIITGRHALDHLNDSIVLWVSHSPKSWLRHISTKFFFFFTYVGQICPDITKMDTLVKYYWS